MTQTPQPVMLAAGGAGSIGNAIVNHALRAGWAVVVHGRTESSSAARLAQLKREHGDNVPAIAIGFDIAEPGAAERMVAAAGAWRGRIDAVVDCISTGPQKRLSGAFAQTEPDGYAAFMELSIVHLQRLAHAALPWLKAQGGVLIAFASDAGLFAASHQTIVGASRAAIMGFVRNLAIEVARDGVRVHCVSPSFVDETRTAEKLAKSDRVERARGKAGLGLPTPDDIAPLVLFLCGDGARKITGQIISVNGGMNA